MSIICRNWGFNSRSCHRSVRVPLKYKADLRLGKWVQTQRQQYKLWQEGKKSSLNEERMAKLNNAGFELALSPSPGNEEKRMKQRFRIL